MVDGRLFFLAPILSILDELRKAFPNWFGTCAPMPVLRATRLCCRQQSAMACPLRVRKSPIGMIVFFSTTAMVENLTQSSRPTSRSEFWMERTAQHRFVV